MLKTKSGDEFLHHDSGAVMRARQYLSGMLLEKGDVVALERALKRESRFGYARLVLARVCHRDPSRRGIKGAGLTPEEERSLCKRWAHCLSKDPDVSAAEKHDRALEILRSRVLFCDCLPPPGEGHYSAVEHDALGVAGGILKRKWEHSGQLEDLIQSLQCYRAGYGQGIDRDGGYTAINYAYISDLLASLGHEMKVNHEVSQRVRREIIFTLLPFAEGREELAPGWNLRWILLTLAEAYLGLGHYTGAYACTHRAASLEAAPWQYEITARQWARIIELQRDICRLARERGVIFALKDDPCNPRLPGAREDRYTAEDVLGRLLRGEGKEGMAAEYSVDSVLIGKLGLALSGGGFRASFFHLGVLARLAELDMLRHIDVLSCVSGGSIVGAAYFITLRKRLVALRDEEITREDYCRIVEELIETFSEGVARNLRCRLSVSVRRMLWRHGVLSSSESAKRLEEDFYRPMWERAFEPASGGGTIDPGPAPVGTIQMHDLNLRPRGFTASAVHPVFNPKHHNWRRRNNVPALVLNATTLNTGHSWQFTTTWMGEWPYAHLKDVSSVSRLTQAWYEPGKGVQVSLGKAVAASAAVPGIFEPVVVEGIYADEQSGDPVEVRLVDGGGYDNQGTVNLVAQDCNVILVSDAAGQLALEKRGSRGPMSLLKFGSRMSSLFMERIRQSTFGELRGKLNAGLIRGLMFVHMKGGLEASRVALKNNPDPGEPQRETGLFTGSGVRSDFQRALSEMRTDLDAFRDEERLALMACGYLMANRGVECSLQGKIPRLVGEDGKRDWAFSDAIRLLTSVDLDEEGARWLEVIREGSDIRPHGIARLIVKIAVGLFLVVAALVGLGALIVR